MDEFIAANRLNWDDRAKLHSTDTTGMYRIAQVLAGGDVLHAIEAGEIGDIAGRRLVHLQCHIGLDTISLASRGAIATGLDFSAEAIEAARDFAKRAGRDVRFVQSDIYEAPAALGETYEVAYVTWGAINWLPDIFRWAQVVADVLEPGGFLYLAESHPATLCLEEIEAASSRITAGARRRSGRSRWTWRLPIPATNARSRTSAPMSGSTRSPISSMRCRRRGCSSHRLNEHELLPYRLFPMMEPADSPGLFRLPDGQPRLALSFSLKAVKRG